jgi:hypothetical protein
VAGGQASLGGANEQAVCACVGMYLIVNVATDERVPTAAASASCTIIVPIDDTAICNRARTCVAVCVLPAVTCVREGTPIWPHCHTPL